MAQQLEINLLVKTQTEAAEKNIQRLSQTLQKISTTPVTVNSGSLDKAVQSAQQLQIHLQNAVNTNTNKIDLTQLNASLKSAGTSLTTLTNNLLGAGTQGQQAFLQVARAISSAEVPMTRMNGSLARFGTTLLNTVKWQIASKLIHGITGALSGAFQHAKNLNSALNSIQIVTGSSAGHMAEFAEKAREAATALNTTTTEYAKASLIFFQQGLDEKAAMARTNTVIKLSQVTKQSVEDISSQMTAIWNNFDDGTKSLEYYADAITALGASTASSSAEIAEGLQKFAAVADTVNLSYEKATAALATVVAQTRQSADIIGTAFKTIFARIEGLKVGEMLEDGVTLNQYSSVLQKIGVNILDSNKQLKDMDTILDLIGEKWQFLTQATKVATAQQVAGLRQYQQFIALMDNYQEVLKNQEIATSSEGTLKEQAEIWSTSWEAASKRVEQSQKNLYDNMINSDFMITIENIFKGLLDGISAFVKASGGIVPTIMMVVGAFSTVLFPLLQKGFSTLSYNISVWTGKAAQEYANMQGALAGQLEQQLTQTNNLSEAEKEQFRLTEQLLNKKAELALASHTMSQAEKAEAEMKMRVYEADMNIVQAALERQAAAEKELKAIEDITKAEERRAILQGSFKASTGYSEERTQAAFQLKDSATMGQAKIDSGEAFLENQAQQKAKQDEITNFSNTAPTTKENIEKLKELETELQQLKEKENEIKEKSPWKQKGEEIEWTTENVKKLTDAYKVAQEYSDYQKQYSGKNIKNAPFQNTEVDYVNTKDNPNGANLSSHAEQIVQSMDAAGGSGEGQVAALTTSIDNFEKLTEEAVTARLAEEDFINAEQQLADIRNKLTPMDAQKITQLKENIKLTQQNVQNAQKNLNAAQKELALKRDDIKIAKQLGVSRKDIKKLEEEELQLRKNVTTATNNYSRAQGEAAKAQSEYRVGTTEAQRTLLNFEEVVLDAAKSSKISAEKVTNFNEALEAVKNSSAADLPGNLDKLKEVLGNMKNEAGDNAEVFENLSRSMALILSDNGVPNIQARADAIRNQGNAAHEAGQKQKNFNNTNIQTQTQTVGLDKKLTSLTSTLSRTAMAYNALKSIGSIWSNEDASVLDKIFSTMMSLSMIIPVVTMVTKALSTAQKISTGVITAETAATQGLVVSKIMLKAVEQFGVAGVVAGIALATVAVGAIAALSAAHQNQTKALQQQREEEAKASQETSKNIDKTVEQTNALNDLIQSYYKLKKAGDDYSAVQTDITDKIPDMISSFEELAEKINLTGDKLVKFTRLITELKLAAAAENVKEIERLQQEISDLLIEESRPTIMKGVGATQYELSEQLLKTKDGGYFHRSGDYLRLHAGDAGTGESTANKKFNRAVEKTLNSNQYRQYGWGTTQFFIDTSSAETMMRDYQALLDLKDELDKTMTDAEKAQDDRYRELQQALKNTEEEFNAFSEAYGAEASLEAWDIVNNRTDEMHQISSYSDYEDFHEKIQKDVQTVAEEKGLDAEELSKAVEKQLDNQSNLSDYRTAELGFNTLETHMGKKTVSAIKEEYNDADEITKKAFEELAPRFGDIYSKEMLDSLIELQKGLDIEDAANKAVQGLDTVKEKLKETGMSAKDWQEVETELKNLNLDINLNTFKNLTYQEQKNIIDTAKRDNILTGLTENIKNIDKARDSIQTARQEYDDWINSDDYKNLHYWLDHPDVPVLTLTTEVPENIVNDVSIGGGYYKDYKTHNYRAETKYPQKANEQKELADNFIKEQVTEDWWKYKIPLFNIGQFSWAMGQLNSYAGKITDASEKATDEAAQAQEAYENYQTRVDNVTEYITERTSDVQQGITKANDQLETELQRQQDYITQWDSQIRQASSLQELDTLVQEGNKAFQKTGLNISFEDTDSYSQGLISIASKYENATDELEKYTQALASHNTEVIKTLENSLKLSIRVGELAEIYGVNAEETEMQARLLQQNSKYANVTSTQLAEIATKNQRLNQGVKDLNENFQSWIKTLTTAGKYSTDYSAALTKMTKALANLTGAASEADIPIDFLDKDVKNGQHHLALMQKAAEGNTQAIALLGNELAEAQINALTFNDVVEDYINMEKQKVSPEFFISIKNTIIDGIQTIREHLDELENGTNLADIFDDDIAFEKWITSLNQMAEATHMSVEQMNGMLSELGVSIPVDTEYVDMKREMPEYATVHEVVENSESPTGYKRKDAKSKITTIYDTELPTGKKTTVHERVPIAKIGKNAKVYATYSGVKSSGGVSNSSTSGKSSSSSSTPKKEASKNASDETERYHVINKETDQLTKAYDRLNTAKDRAFGANRLKLMDAEIANIKKQIALNKEYINQAKSYAQQDYNNLINGKQNAYTINGEWYSSEGLRGLGIELQLNEDGVIQNYDEIMAAATTKYNERIAAYNANPTNSNLKDIAEKEFQSIKDLISQYETSNELVQTKLDENQTLLNKLQDDNLTKFNYKLELKLKISERDKKRIEFELKQLGDDAFKSAEVLSKMFSTDNSASQWTNALKQLQLYKDQFNELNTLYENGDISEEGYIEGLEQISDGLYTQLEVVLELKTSMEDYYKNTLSKLKEKYDELKTSMTRTSEVLDHIKTLLQLTGKSVDYNSIGKILEGQAEISKNAYDVSKANYEKDVKLRKQREKELIEAQKKGGAEQIKIAEDNLKAARDAEYNSQIEMLSDLENYLTKRKEIINNNIEKSYAEAEKILSNGLGFDYLNQTMELASATAERFYTKTNQLYETEKMRRKLQQDIDKTTNTAAKQRLAAFEQEIQLMQDKEKLSKTELSLAQARYDLLLAQIALEEAQNAKTTVRLQRDTNGNYGYVYTADLDNVTNAEQEVADKQNNLYNTAREAEENSLKESISLRQDWLEACKKIDEDETLSTTDKAKRKQEISDYYLGQIEDLNADHSLALEILNTASATQMNDTWTTNFQNVMDNQEIMVTNFETEQDKLNEYLYGKDGKSGAFGALADAARDVLGVELSNLGTIIGNNTSESKKFKEELIGADGKGGLVKATQDEANAVATLTTKFGEAYDAAEPFLKTCQGINESIDLLIQQAANKIIIETEYQDHHEVDYHITYRYTGNPPPTSSGGNQTSYVHDPGYEPPDLDPTPKKGPSKKTDGFYVKIEPRAGGPKKIVDVYVGSEKSGIDVIKGQMIVMDDTLPSQIDFVSDEWKAAYVYQVVNGYENILKQYTNGITEAEYKKQYPKFYNRSNEKNLEGITHADTGGYTGSWYHSSDNPYTNGKLAVLHEKELILNQEDTKNMLAAVNVVRSLQDVLDARMAAYNFETLASSGVLTGNTGELEQNITIHADFPNVQDHNEIKEALENLALRAAQYAARNK